MPSLISHYEHPLKCLLHNLVNGKENANISYYSMYITSLMSLINRVLILDSNYMLHSLVPDIDLFLCQWFSHMDNILSNDSRKLNTIAILKVLPLLSVTQV